MSLRPEELYPASFRGATFLIENHTAKAGRKVVTHEFPNSDKRDVEDLGLLNNTFTIQGLITGDDYILKRNALIKALSTGGLGILTHPFLGVRTVTPLPYSLHEKTNNLGVAVFNMTFNESQPNTSPFPQLNNISEIIDSIADLSDKLSQQTATDFFVSLKSRVNFESGLEKVNANAALFTESTRQYSNDPEFINEFSKTLSIYKENNAILVNNPTQLGQSNQNLFNQANDLAVNVTDGYNLMAEFFDYGDDDDPINLTTIERIERERNNKVFNAQIQGTALILAYQNSVLDEYDTTIDIQNRVNALEVQYIKIAQNPFMDSDSLTTLTDLRSKVITFFRNLEISAYKLSIISTNTIPISVLTFQYYGNLDLTQTLVDLNNIKNVSYVKGQIDILTP